MRVTEGVPINNTLSHRQNMKEAGGMRVRETGYILGNSVHNYLYLRHILQKIPAADDAVRTVRSNMFPSSLNPAVLLLVNGLTLR